MPISRRGALLQGAVVGVGYFGNALWSINALAQSQQLPQRKSLGVLPVNDPIIDAWRETVRKLREKPASDKLSWSNLASIHGTASGFNKCPHGNWYFLPWHRAYLLMYERLARDLTGFKEFALPYWDWTNYRQLPAAFTSETWNGTRNHLYEARSMSPTDSLPNENVGTDVMRTIMNGSDFEVFGTSRPLNQNSLDPSWITRRTGSQGELEGNPHNNVHGLVGGVMGGVRSANDPIFMTHHCNIDRIWAVWRRNGGVDSTNAFWLNMPFQDHFLNTDGSPYSPKVSDLLAPETLGYTYGDLGPEVSPRPNVVALSSRINSIFLGPAVSSAVGVRKFQAANTGEAMATQPLEIPVSIGTGLVASVARQPSFAGPELSSANRLQEAAGRGPRVLAFLREVATTNSQSTQYRVFLNCDYLSQQTPLADPHYVGTFGFFGDESGGHGDHEGLPSITVDLTATIQRVFGSAPAATDVLRVQILPVPRGKAAINELGTAKPSGVEVAFI